LEDWFWIIARKRGQEILATDDYSEAVREREAVVLNAGIHSVPAVVINERHLVSGGQPVEVYERVIREVSPSTKLSHRIVSKFLHAFFTASRIEQRIGLFDARSLHALAKPARHAQASRRI
jgi:hypothetical protein